MILTTMHRNSSSRAHFGRLCSPSGSDSDKGIKEILEIKHMIGKDYGKRIINALDRCNRNLLEFKRQCENEYMILESDDLFALNMERLAEEISVFMEKDYHNYVLRKNKI